jgi:hypothetical protein
MNAALRLLHEHEGPLIKWILAEDYGLGIQVGPFLYVIRFQDLYHTIHLRLIIAERIDVQEGVN